FNAPLNNSLANGGGTNVYNNNASGTFPRDTATGILIIGIPFNNVFNMTAGTVNVNTGTLRFSVGGSSAGTISVPSGSTLDFSGGTFNISAGSVTGAGTFSVSGGTTTVAAPVTLGITGTMIVSNGTLTLNTASDAVDWLFSAGNLNGSGAINIASGKSFGWSGGTMGGTGTTTIAAGATLTISAGVTLSRTIINNGTTNWTAGQFAFSNGTFQNNASFNAPLSNNITNGGGTNAFNTTASSPSPRDTATGILAVGIPFTNAGTVNVNTGTLRISAGGSSTGTISVPSGTTLDLSGGTFDISSGTVNGAGTFLVSGATTTVAAPVTLGITGS